ncbi:MAG TPA: DUF2911 domain-containing protein [Flavobacteriia bacterium]|jgi:tetratricopeptide (TPR) repeat protein|nr:DUF2911 domain-containing protein [Flavobacteriia bacterium]
MYKKLAFALLCFATLTISAQVKAPAPSPTSKTELKVGLTDVSLEYSRPSMRGRKIFGNLVPYGKVWRTGANANTKISFGDDVTINGDSLKKGTYAIYTIPNEQSWEVIFYSDANNWGTPQKWDDSKVALKTTAKALTFPDMNMETFTILIDNLADGKSGDLNFLWDDTIVTVKIGVPTDAIAQASIDKIMGGPTANDYFAAASYYRNTGKDLKQALTWIDKAVQLRKDAYWMTREKSLILAALGKKKEAIEAAKVSLEKAKEKGNNDYVKMNTDAIAEWSK